MPTTDTSTNRLRELMRMALDVVAQIPESLTPFVSIKARRSEAVDHINVDAIMLGHSDTEDAALVDLVGEWGTPHSYERPSEFYAHWTLMWRRGNVRVEVYGPGVDRFVRVVNGAPTFVLPEAVAS